MSFDQISDHTDDLISLFQAMMLARRTRDLHLTAPAGFDVFLDGLLALQPWARPHNTVCRLDEIEAQTRRALDGSLTFHRG